MLLTKLRLIYVFRQYGIPLDVSQSQNFQGRVVTMVIVAHIWTDATTTAIVLEERECATVKIRVWKWDALAGNANYCQLGKIATAYNFAEQHPIVHNSIIIRIHHAEEMSALTPCVLLSTNQILQHVHRKERADWKECA
jgi:hypothetical protein